MILCYIFIINIIHVVKCNNNKISLLNNNGAYDKIDFSTHTFNLLSPIRQHHSEDYANDNKIQQNTSDSTNEYEQIAKKLIGIEKLGDEIAHSNYLPSQITNIKPPNPNENQNENMSSFNNAINDTSERLASTAQSELESNPYEIKERDKIVNSVAKSFKKSESPINANQSHLPNIEDELEIIENEKNKEPHECLPDYSLPCSKDYILYDNYCIATKSYKGNCSHKIKAMWHEDQDFKSAWSKECKSEWNCMPEKCTTVDYDKECPITFTSDGKYCRSPIGAESQYVRFENVRQKIEFERSNHVRWPCKVDYVSDYAKECPKNYVKRGKTCKSITESLIEYCDSFEIPMTVDLKLEIQERCVLDRW